jgi:hypothetical protein
MRSRGLRVAGSINRDALSRLGCPRDPPRQHESCGDEPDETWEPGERNQEQSLGCDQVQPTELAAHCQREPQACDPLRQELHEPRGNRHAGQQEAHGHGEARTTVLRKNTLTPKSGNIRQLSIWRKLRMSISLIHRFCLRPFRKTLPAL